MSIEDTDVIDIIGTNRTTGETVLTISDHLDWSDSANHLTLLQSKLNRYLAFVESGEILEQYPNADLGKIVFEVVFKFLPDDAGRDFLKRVKPIIESAGFAFEEQLSTNAGFN